MNRAADNSELGEVRTQLGLAVLAVLTELAQGASRSNTPRTKKTSNESLVSSIRL